MEPIEEFIRKDPHVKGLYLSIHRSPMVGAAEYPSFGEHAAKARMLADMLGRYVEGPIIVDDFTNHSERRAWREECEQRHPEFHNFYWFNRLKVNRMNVVKNSLPLLMRWYAGGNKPEANYLSKEIVACIPSGNEYEAIAIEEKIELAEDISGKVVRILSLIGS